MMKYEIIEQYNDITKLKFTDCGHERTIKTKHLESGNYICTLCSNIKNLEYYYDFENGLKHKSEYTRKCRICNEEDKMSNLISIPKLTKSNAYQFWFYHSKCLCNQGHDKHSMEILINSNKVKNKDIIIQDEKKVEVHNEKTTKKQLPSYIINKINTKRIEDQKGIKVDFQEPITILNKTYYDINFKLNEIFGVYAIKNIINNKTYIGSSNDIESRFKTHYKQLTSSTHENYKLQSDYIKYGKDAFEFWILEIADSSYKTTTQWIYSTEQKYMDVCNSYLDGYNIHPIAGFRGSKEDYEKLINK